MSAVSLLSTQELAIRDGKNILSGTATDRVLRMYEAIRASGAPRLEICRSLHFTESFKETEGEPIVLRWAKFLRKLAENIQVTILSDELIVGRAHTYFGAHVLEYPEVDGSLHAATFKIFDGIKGKPGYIAVAPEDRKVIEEQILPYWEGKDYLTAFNRSLPEETRYVCFGPDRTNFNSSGVVIASAALRSSSNHVPDYEKFLRVGIKGLRQEAQAFLDALTNPNDFAIRSPFYQAVIITCDAISLWVKRHAKLASEMAANEKDPARKKELAEIAVVCDWVCENPARTFREALQLQWILQCWLRMEQACGSGVQSGRMDQYMYPFFKKDLDERLLTREAALELLECVWLNMEQVTPSMLSPSGAAMTEGFAHFELVVMGGLTSEGQDATNDLTYVILESTRVLQIAYPDTCVRIHANTPDKLLHSVVEAIKDGKGTPKLLNDEALVPFYVDLGVKMPEALDYSPSSCADSRAMHRETSVTGNGAFNFGLTMEMTLRNGRVKIWKETQFGPATGDPRGFKTYEDLWAAYRTQLLNLVKHVMIQLNVAVTLGGERRASPVNSMVFKLSMESAMDLHQHGRNIPNSVDIGYVETAGKATVIDSLAAIKHLIFDTKKLTWDQLLTAMDANWEGHEAIRQLCLNAPKFGNGIAWVDHIGWELEDAICRYLKDNPRPNGQCFVFRQVPVTMHVPFGKATAATPNGRHAGDFLSEGISPSHGCDVKGPTVAIQSMARGRAGSWGGLRGPDLANMKFSPATIAGEEGTRRLMQIIRTWSSSKLWHIQFNILNRETLLAAQKDPEKYRNLIVRIAGYSAYFVDLSPAQQAEVIARTEEKV